MSEKNVFYKIEKSALVTAFGIILLFSSAIIVTLIAPNYVDQTWIKPTSDYQVQMYEVADPNIYISSLSTGSSELQSVYRLQRDFTLLAFHEAETVRIVAPPELEKYISRYESPTLKLTSRLMMLRKPQKNGSFDAEKQADTLQQKLQQEWAQKNPKWEEQRLQKPAFDIFELYEIEGNEAFAVAATERILENWVDEDYTILDEKVNQEYHDHSGVIYVNNPLEYRVTHYTFGGEEGWRYDPEGEVVKGIEELKSHPLGFLSRRELIRMGETTYAEEGCWYCHSDQTRTLVQDVVLNGSEAYPAPPSSANEYIYERITFPATRRIGPDISRVGVKRPSRDWHQSHFWSPKTASAGSIMPAFQHFFDYDPRGTGKKVSGVPNVKFEAVFQYLMTKGTRITPPTQAWWLGKDPLQTKEIIEGKKVLE